MTLAEQIAKSSYLVLSYKVKNGYAIEDFLSYYKRLLQKALREIWSNIAWVEKKQKDHMTELEEPKRGYATNV